MFRFFRSIRQKLFLEGRVSRYIGYAIGEIMLIVIGILLALQISNWNQERNKRLEEAEILDGLQREFQGYRDSLLGSIAGHAEMMSGMAAILQSIDAGVWVSDEWTIDEAINRSLRPPTSDLGNGVRDALVQGGRLELISDRVLRERLAEWPKHFEEVKDDQTFGRRMVFDTLIPYLTSKGFNLSAIYWKAGSPVDQQPIAADPEAVRRLLSDPEYRALIQVRYGLWNHARGEIQTALDAANAILDLIDAELAERGMGGKN
jgi:hypothetical protein